jgi:hypothetical protein
MTIKLITLKTNHTLLGEVTESSKESFVTIKQPVQVVSIPPRAANDSGSIAFSPFLEYAKEFKEGFKINPVDILVVSTPVEELENQYNSIFGSGIVVPPKKSIIT